MRSNFKRKKTGKKAASLFVLFALPSIALVWLGCKTQVSPLGAYPPASGSPNYSLVCNFESAALGANTATTNPYLYEIGAAGNTIVAPGSWGIQSYLQTPGPGGNNMTIAAPGANGTAQAAYVHASLYDPGDGSYPSIQLGGGLDANSPFQYKAYNMSFFSGIKFYINITANDTALSRYFYIRTANEEPSATGGYCGTSAGCPSGGCYNYFGYTFTGPTNGWKLFTFNFTDLTTQSYGCQPNPSTLTGQNLKEVLGLLWSEGRSNTKGTSTIDFWVDEINFY